MFESLCGAPATDFLLIQQLQRLPATQVPCTLFSGLVLCNASRYVRCDPGVNAAIAASQQVNAVNRSLGHASRVTRFTDGGYLSSNDCGRMGLDSKFPPQFGHRLSYTTSAHWRQNVHSNVQITASEASGGRSRSQCSQFGRNSSTTGFLRRDRLKVCHQARETRRTPGCVCSHWSHRK